MTDIILVQAITGVMAAGLGSYSSYKLLEWRITKLEKSMEDNEGDHKQFRTMEQHTECKTMTCGKIGEVKGIVSAHTSTLNQLKACINKHVAGCREIE